MAKVKFFAVDLKSTFEALTIKDEFALYWIIETQELYKGNILFGVGKEATANTSGLMSAEDKRKLDTFAGIEGGIRFLGVSSTNPEEGVITIDGEVVTVAAGEIVIYGTKEYICDKSGSFVELGDESIYLTVARAEVEFLKKADAQAIYQSKEEAEKEHKQLEEIINLINVKDVFWGKDEANGTKYEVVSAVDGFLTDDSQNDLRVFIPKDSKYEKQNVGTTGDASKFYMTVRAWSPRGDVTACRKGDYTNYDRDFAEMEKISIDAKSGRPYVDFWLPIAYTEDDGATWKEYADLSTDTKYIGFTWLVEWYVGDKLVASGSKKITLVNNHEIFYNNKDWYIPALEAKLKETTTQFEEATVKLEEAKAQLEQAKTSMIWGVIS